MFLLVLLVVAGRIFSRLRYLGVRLESDDWLIIAAMVSILSIISTISGANIALMFLQLALGGMVMTHLMDGRASSTHAR